MGFRKKQKHAKSTRLYVRLGYNGSSVSRVTFSKTIFAVCTTTATTIYEGRKSTIGGGDKIKTNLNTAHVRYCEYEIVYASYIIKRGTFFVFCFAREHMITYRLQTILFVVNTKHLAFSYILSD